MIQNTQDRNKITSETSNYPIQIVRDSELNIAVKSEWIALRGSEAGGQTSEWI